ncbi:hypothetical protein [Amycolatopsis sp. CA-126428]|uniref:hypothetical protein n=1 Tax=Amycolatopsis sp. CA-126428 TaxID=2073158 RepID=UPI0011B03799|nr:hypothetical protein [Amycolatopsis sp. CA-126428]
MAGQRRAPSGPGRPADPATARRVRAGIGNFVACVNAGDPAKPDDLAANPAATLFTVHFITTFMHQDSYASVPRVLGGLRIDRMRVLDVIAYRRTARWCCASTRPARNATRPGPGRHHRPGQRVRRHVPGGAATGHLHADQLRPGPDGRPLALHGMTARFRVC